MYHWVPSTISGESQMLGSAWVAAISTTTKGKSTLAGKAARNWAIGCRRSAQAGLSPIQTPIGTQMTVVSAISTTTRARVARP